MTWHSFKAPSAQSGPTSWTSTGGRGHPTDHDGASVAWTPPAGPIDVAYETPDITALIDEANQLHGGILRLMLIYHAEGLGAPRVDWHSLEGPDATMRPNIFFDAF